MRANTARRAQRAPTQQEPGKKEIIRPGCGVKSGSSCRGTPNAGSSLCAGCPGVTRGQSRRHTHGGQGLSPGPGRSPTVADDSTRGSVTPACREGSTEQPELWARPYLAVCTRLHSPPPFRALPQPVQLPMTMAPWTPTLRRWSPVGGTVLGRPCWRRRVAKGRIEASKD